MSNEHPDMSGNPADAPYVCEKCGHQFTDDTKLCGSFFSTATILCSQECSVEYDYAIAEKLSAENTQLRDLLCSARCIAERNGKETDWDTFSRRIASFGIGSVTPRVFKVTNE